jgi:hypothetical protein
MPKIVELELLQGRNNYLTVMTLMENTKSQDKYRIVFINAP